MKRFAMLCKPISLTAGAALGTLLMFCSAFASAQAQTTEFLIIPKRIIGTTCVEDPNNKENKCLSLQPSDAGMLMPVSDFFAPLLGDQDIVVQFCAKVEDENFQELECQVDIDSEVAIPGSLKPNENANNTIYSFCFNWVGKSSGTREIRSLTQIEVLCERKDNDDNTEVNINDYTVTVFGR
ncbi:MAG: hypothetical protein AAF699_19650 [Pseudomonadota bacterium]